jgi:hypothetical protein
MSPFRLPSPSASDACCIIERCYVVKRNNNVRNNTIPAKSAIQVARIHTIIYFYLMNAKPYPNRKRYHDVLRKMSPEQKVKKMFELNALGKELILAGLQTKYPEMDKNERHTLFLKTIMACHNRNY